MRKEGAEASKPTTLPIGITKRRLWRCAHSSLSSPFLTCQKKELKAPGLGRERRQGTGHGHPPALGGEKQQGEEGCSDSHSENGLHILHSSLGKMHKLVLRQGAQIAHATQCLRSQVSLNLFL